MYCSQARCEIAERDNQALLEYIEELTTKRKSPSPSKRMSVFSHSQIKDMRVRFLLLLSYFQSLIYFWPFIFMQENSGDVPVNSDDAARVMRLTWEPLSVSVPLSDAKGVSLSLLLSIDRFRLYSKINANFKLLLH